ncbi:carboxypeptidase-like regulatory domain-containing protein [Reichenbachiella sp. MALMAid0571]|uniref:carboxypeptidase-like regulatory domain-containing protein n=1 Tax=Reichenbachiella sp. MALMAid0571 TaxID=3143939 RepID=UPI0032DF19B9
MGKIVDKNTHTPVQYVNIWWENTTKGTYSNSNGTFSISRIENGTLALSYLGYLNFKYNCCDYIEDSLLIELTPSPRVLNEITIKPATKPKVNKYGFVQKSLIPNWFSAMITKEQMLHLKFTLENPKAKEGFVHSINFRIKDIQPKGKKLILTVYFSDITDDTKILNSVPIHLRISMKESQPFFSADISEYEIPFSKEGLNMHFVLNGLVNEIEGELRPGIVDFHYSQEKDKKQMTFMRYSPNVSWNKSEDFFYDNGHFDNLNVWLEVEQ